MRSKHSRVNQFSQSYGHSRQMLLALLLVAFAWLQFAGLAHKYAHPQIATGHAASMVGETPDDKSFLGHSLGHSSGHSQQNKSDCQLFDLQCSDSALSQAMPALALPVFSVQTLWHKAATFSNSTWLVYQARAPPQTSI
jgi:hypothetical protein